MDSIYPYQSDIYVCAEMFLENYVGYVGRPAHFFNTDLRAGNKAGFHNANLLRLYCPDKKHLYVASLPF